MGKQYFYQDGDRGWVFVMRDGVSTRCDEAVKELLRAALAPREAEVGRLREALEAIIKIPLPEPYWANDTRDGWGPEDTRRLAQAALADHTP